MGDFSTREFDDFDHRACKFFLHSSGWFNRHPEFHDLLNLSSLNVNNGVQNLADEAQFNFANQSLDGFESRVGVGHPQQTNPSKPNIGENFEIPGASYFVENDEIGANKEDDFCCLFQVPFQWSILRNSIGKLQIPGGFHGFDHGSDVGVEVFCDGLGQGGFS